MKTATFIGLILDESGSMEPKRADVIGGYNAFLADQRAVLEQCRMTVFRFADTYAPLVVAMPIGFGPRPQ